MDLCCVCGDGWSADHWTEPWWPETEHWGEDEGEEGEPEKESEKEKDLQEAELLALEANRTLQQARQAVAATRQARGSYEGKNKGDSGKAKSKGKGKGKLKSAMKGCLICGRPEHYWRQCPDRFANFGGKGKGKQGKKGKVSFFDTEETESWRWIGGFSHKEWITVLALRQRGVSSTKAQADTGATETAGGLRAVEECVAHLMEQRPATEVEVCRHDRPWFKYADGNWGRALSRVDVQLGPGNFSIYTIDADTPILAGADFWDKMGATIS